MATSMEIPMKKRWQELKYCLLFFMCLLSSVFYLLVDKAAANNIAVLNVSLENESLSQKTANVQFDISWDNSWRTVTNYDAAWVFIKYSTNAGLSWNHATLKTSGTNPMGFYQGTGTPLDIIVPMDKKGAFLQRFTAGSGSVSTSSIQFVWDYGADGVIDTSTVRVKVFAIEMVYIPAGAFYIGSGGTETSVFYTYPTTTNPYLINSEDAISVGTTNGNLYYSSGTYDYPSSTLGGDQAGPIPAAFPKGYAAFYMMKYRISQGQYANFLNTLTPAQASTKYPNKVNDISGIHPNYFASHPDEDYGNLSWADNIAYTYWAALRPFTELEFEKAAKGPSFPKANKYVSEHTSMTPATTISDTRRDCNCGESYYGVMGLGNSLERAVTVGNSTGRAFIGSHGNGTLTGTGDADFSVVTDWPRIGALGTGDRWSCTSDRYYAAVTDSTRVEIFGGRAVRTSP